MKTGHIRLLLVTLITTLSPFVLSWGQALTTDGLDISGTVVDAVEGTPLPGANVYLINHWRIGSSSDAEGQFRLTVPEEALGDTLVCSFIGFRDVRIPLKNWRYGQKILLRSLDNQLNEVQIEATTLAAEEYQYQAIQKLEIYTNPAANADPLLAVNSLPSATPVDESANISLRGSPSAQTGVFFNDVPIYEYVKFSQLTGIGVFSIFNTAIVKEVSVFPGNPPLEYGNSSSGILSVKADEIIPKVSNNSITVSPASFGYFRQQRINDRFSLSVFGNYQPGGLLKRLNPSSLRNIEGFDLLDVGVYLFGKIGNRSKVKFFNYSLSEQYTFSFMSPSFNGPFDQRRRRNFSTLKYEWRKDRHVINFNGGFSVSGAEFNFSQFKTELDGKDYFLGFNYQYFGDRFEWKAGISSDNRNQSAIGTTPQFFFALGEAHPSFSFDTDEKIRTNESFLYGKYLLNSSISIGAGLRTNAFFEGDTYLSSQVNLKYQISDFISFIIGAGRYHQTLFDRSRGTNLIKADQVSADLKWTSVETLWSLSLFWKKDNQTLESPIVRGVEAFIERKLADRLKASLSASYLDSDVPISLDAFDPSTISYYIRSNFSWRFLNDWTLGGNILYREGNSYFRAVGSQFDEDLRVFAPEFDEMPTQLPNYFTLGISLSNQFALSERVSLIAFASLNNVTDHQNVRSFIYDANYTDPQAELFSLRTVYFGGVIRF